MAEKPTALDDFINRVSREVTRPGRVQNTQLLAKTHPEGTILWYVMENAAAGWRVQRGPFTSEWRARDSMEGWMRTSSHYKVVSALVGETPG